MCTLVHWVECAIIWSLDPVLYRKIQGRESLYSGIFYALVSDSRTARIIYFCIKICSLQLLFDTVQLLFSFSNSLLCTCSTLLLTNWKKTLIFSCNNIRINKHSIIWKLFICKKRLFLLTSECFISCCKH